MPSIQTSHVNSSRGSPAAVKNGHPEETYLGGEPRLVNRHRYAALLSRQGKAANAGATWCSGDFGHSKRLSVRGRGPTEW